MKTIYSIRGNESLYSFLGCDAPDPKYKWLHGLKHNDVKSFWDTADDPRKMLDLLFFLPFESRGHLLFSISLAEMLISKDEDERSLFALSVAKSHYHAGISSDSTPEYIEKTYIDLKCAEFDARKVAYSTPFSSAAHILTCYTLGYDTMASRILNIATSSLNREVASSIFKKKDGARYVSEKSNQTMEAILKYESEKIHNFDCKITPEINEELNQQARQKRNKELYLFTKNSKEIKGQISENFYNECLSQAKSSDSVIERQHNIADLLRSSISYDSFEPIYKLLYHRGPLAKKFKDEKRKERLSKINCK